MLSTKKMVFLSLMVSLSLVLSLIDARIPLLAAVPGIKLGLASIITLVVLNFFGWKATFLVLVIRSFLAWFFHGSPIALALSLIGGSLSLLFMTLLFKGYPKYFSLIGISAVGGASHNLGQLIAASLLIQTPALFNYLPYLLIAGVLSGLYIGFISYHLCKILNEKKIL